jgi:hypothetical protein
MQMLGDVQDTDVNSQLVAPGTSGVASSTQLAPADGAPANSSPAAASEPATAILAGRQGLTAALLIVPVLTVLTLNSRNDQLARFVRPSALVVSRTVSAGVLQCR